MHQRFRLLIVGGVLSFAPPALATTPTDAAAAQALFERGRAAAERGDLQQACESFAESQRLDPGAGTLMNWATCEARRGQVASAWGHFNEAAGLLVPGDDRARFVEGQIRALSKRLPRLTLRVARDAPAGTRIVRGGTELGPASFGLPLPVDPGKVQLVVRAPGRRERSSVVDIAEGEQLVVLVEPGEAEAPSVGVVNPPPPGPPQSHLQRDVGVGLVAFGSLGVGVGLASGVVASARKSTVDEHCIGFRCDAVGLEAARSGERWLVVNTVAWSVGAAALVGGGVLWLTSPSQEAETQLLPLSGGMALLHTERF